MTNIETERWDRFVAKVDELTKAFLTDPVAFSRMHPHIPITLRAGKAPRAAVMESIAETLDPDGGWKIVETVGGDAFIVRMPT